MKLAELRYLADENFDPDVIAYLRTQGWDIVSTTDRGLRGKPDIEVLRAATAEGRVILTHDGDFGRHAVVDREPFVGIVRIRPGHIRGEFTIATLDAVIARKLDVHPPFILIARRTDDMVNARVRQL